MSVLNMRIFPNSFSQCEVLLIEIKEDLQEDTLLTLNRLCCANDDICTDG